MLQKRLQAGTKNSLVLTMRPVHTSRHISVQHTSAVEGGFRRHHQHLIVTGGVLFRPGLCQEGSAIYPILSRRPLLSYQGCS